MTARLKRFLAPRWRVFVQRGEHPMLRQAGVCVSEHWFFALALLSVWLCDSPTGEATTAWIEPIGGAQ